MNALIAYLIFTVCFAPVAYWIWNHPIFNRDRSTGIGLVERHKHKRNKGE